MNWVFQIRSNTRIFFAVVRFIYFMENNVQSIVPPPPPVAVGFPSLATSGACVATLIDVFIGLLSDSRKHCLDFEYDPGYFAGFSFNRFKINNASKFWS